MALDGFSLRQVGLGQDSTSAQMTAQTEQAGKFSKNKTVETIQASALTIKEDDEQEQQKKKKKGKNNELVDGFAEEDIEKENVNEDLPKKTNKTFKKKKKLHKYEFSEDISLRINTSNDTIELYNKNTDKKLESINSEDFSKLISKLNISSGIMVNKHI